MNSTEDREESFGRNANPYTFSETFLAGFNAMMTAYDRELHKLQMSVDESIEYGVCNCSYKLRYITPSNVATYINNLDILGSHGIFGHHNHAAVRDYDLFAVESAKRFIRENGCVPLEQTSVSGNPISDIPKGATLKDITFATLNEAFNVCVYSRYELKKRRELMRDDLKRIQDMHFSASMRTIVDRLPSVLRQECLPNPKHMIVCIQDFILFASMLNLTTVIQMQGYAIPRDGYKLTDVEKPDVNEDGIHQESVNFKAAHPIFFIFTEGKTPFISKAISKATNSPYSHISISFDPSLENMYSFGGGGVRKESIRDGVLEKLDISVFGAYVTKEHADQMKTVSDDFLTNASKTKFSYSALVKKLFGSDRKDNSGYRQICTTFVNRLLSEINHPLVNKNIPSPKEMRDAAITNADRLFELYKGPSKEYNSKKAADLLKAMAKKEKSKSYDEVVTECCMLKTNDYVIANRLPFNCNMKTVVLQDITNEFSDTLSALEFIMNDARSPVHGLIVQYFDPKRLGDVNTSTISRLLTGCNPYGYHSECDKYGHYKPTTHAASSNNGNWLDAITFGNMFQDGNYRRDAVGNNHVHPIMNTLEMVYKMFGGCDNECDNTKLAHNLIDVANTMKHIIQDCSVAQDRDVTRDVLAVLGEIFTRNMLRLYYNNNHSIQSPDQMNSTMAPAYMYSESFILEADGFTSNNQTSGVKSAGVTAKNVVTGLINWIRNKLSKFLPDKFNNAFQAQVQWFNKNGKARYDEIMKAYQEQKYKFPKKDKLQQFNVSLVADKVNPEEIARTYLDGSGEIKTEEVKQKLLNMFNNHDDLAKELAAKNGEELTKGLTNAVLYSKIDPVPPIENQDIKDAQFKVIYEDLAAMCNTNGDKHYIKQFENLSQRMVKALENLQNEAKQTVQQNSFIILNKGSVFTESGTNTNPANGSSPKPSDSQPAPEPPKEGDNNKSDNGSQNNTQQNAEQKKTEKAQRADTLIKIFQEVSSSCYVTAANAIVRNLFPTIYGDFKGICDDFAKMKNSGTNADAQKDINNNNQTNPTQPATTANTGESGTGTPAQANQI